jgi:ATP-dependent Clp protease ATP-binding subunit ClpA
VIASALATSCNRGASGAAAPGRDCHRLPSQPIVRFSREAHEALEWSRASSYGARHDTIVPAFIALGILHGENEATKALHALRLDTIALFRALRAATPADSEVAGGPDLAFSSHGVAILDYAMRNAQARSSATVSTVDLLLGVLQCSADTAALILENAGVDSLRVRRPPSR